MSPARNTSPFEWEDAWVRVHRAAPVHARVTVPGSKSLTNRLLLLAALASGESRLGLPLDAEDTRLMAEALRQMGISIGRQTDAWWVRSTGALRVPEDQIYVGNAGTVMRFLTPILATLPEPSVLNCSPRMKKRPIGDLGDSLKQLGGRLIYLEKDGYPPVRVAGPLRGGSVHLPGMRSSQYLSGLLMALPRISGSTTITLSTPLVSRTYVDMTLWCLKQFGVAVEAASSGNEFMIRGVQTYHPVSLDVEPDASTSSYWWALPLMLGGEIHTGDVSSESSQGDAGLLDIFEQMGARLRRGNGTLTVCHAPLQGIDVDMNTMSDVAPTLAVVATQASSPTTILGVGHMRIKECDRIATLQTAFDQLGLRMESGPDWMRIYPGTPNKPAELDPQEDHRMAMVFTLLGLAYGKVKLLQPNCVSKTYPKFFSDMENRLDRA